MTVFKKQILLFIFRFWFLLVLILTMGAALMGGDLLPQNVARGFVTISQSIRSILVFLLPFLVFPFVVSSLANLKSHGPVMIVSLIALIAVSNFVSILIGGGVGALLIPHLNISPQFNAGDAHGLEPFFALTLSPVCSIEGVLIVGFLSGLALSMYPNGFLLDGVHRYRHLSSLFFQRIFIPVLPFYIFGVLLKLDAENDFMAVFRDFGHIIVVIIATQVTYITAMFFVGNDYSVKRTIAAISNCLPAGVLGFSTMSSLVTMPVTLKAAEKNLRHKTIAHLAITTTVNCHDVGECISLTLISLCVYAMGNGMVLPDFWTFIQFAAVLSIAQFTGVSVPGGSAVVIIPLLISYLDFSPEMVGLVTMLSIFMDPVGTCHNVLGNSAFALIIEKYCFFLNRLFKKDFNASSAPAGCYKEV